MRTSHTPIRSSVCILTAFALVQAGTSSAGFFTFDEAAPQPRSRLSVGWSPVLNVSADFSGIGTFTASDSGPFPYTSPPPVNRTYDDGFVLVDSTGNGGGYTTYWSYDNLGQLDTGNLADANVLTLSSTSVASPGISRDVDGEIQQGLAFTYNLRLLDVGRRGAVGLEATLGWNHIELRDSRTFYGDLTVVMDQYDVATTRLFGGIPPPPYQGPFDQGSDFAALLPETPLGRTTTMASGTPIPGERCFDANVYQLRLGPYAELPITRRLSVALSAGLALGFVDSEFSWQESAVVTGSTLSASESGNYNALEIGGYVGGTVRCMINNQWSVFGSATYQNIGTYNHSVGAKEASVDFGTEVFVSGGIGFSF